MIQKIVAVGDCNTLGAGDLHYNSYPERVARIIGGDVVNLGHTMATTREGVLKLHDFLDDADCVLIQFGLVDSYTTIKNSPYILYYPDTQLRKILRSAVKKYKKICKQKGLHSIFGEENVVNRAEYKENLRKMVNIARPRSICLIDTIPHHESYRNKEIKCYNKILDELCLEYDFCIKIDLYHDFEQNLHKYYSDSTHCNALGYDVIAKKIVQKLTHHPANPNTVSGLS